MCEEKQLSEEGAELALANAYQLQAFAHRYLATKAASHDEETRDRMQSLAEEMFDLAVKEFETGFGANSVHVARFSENPEPYKLVIGGLLYSEGYMGGEFVRKSLIEVLCRIHGLDPDGLRDLYVAWRNERFDSVESALHANGK